MRNKQFKLSYFIVIVLIGVLVFGLGFTSYSRRVPREVYQVYIDGEIIGTVSDDLEFEDYINKKQFLLFHHLYILDKLHAELSYYN